jgi:hypothetical protein
LGSGVETVLFLDLRVDQVLGVCRFPFRESPFEFHVRFLVRIGSRGYDWWKGADILGTISVGVGNFPDIFPTGRAQVEIPPRDPEYCQPGDAKQIQTQIAN